jgi:hypothetical protein
MEFLILFGLFGVIARVCASAKQDSTSTLPPFSSETEERYKFDYRKVGGGWRAYIQDQPSYRGRRSDLETTHRHYDEHGYYVCWSKPITSRSKCEAIAKKWARLTNQYIESGRQF